MKRFIITGFILISFLISQCNTQQTNDTDIIPEPELPREEQLDELKQMSDDLKQKIGPTNPPMVPAQNLTQEEQMEQLKEMSDELNKKIEPTEPIQMPDANLTKEEKIEHSEILAGEITRRLDTEPH